jgi:hypothetical protein
MSKLLIGGGLLIYGMVVYNYMALITGWSLILLLRIDILEEKINKKKK